MVMSDSGQLEPTQQPPAPELPEIVDLTIVRAPFEPPRLRHFESVLSRYDEAIEFHVHTSEPLPIADVSPMLYIGQMLLTEMRGDADEREYTFYAFDEERLEEGAPIAFGYPGSPPNDASDSEYRYQTPEGN